jgi:predicted transcriptional regulator
MPYNINHLPQGIEHTSRKGIEMTLEIIENSPKRRDKLIIMAEIIGIAKKGTSKTHIMFKANLSFSQLNQYLSVLSNTGLLEKSENNGRVVFQATPKGLEFVERQQRVIDLLSDNSCVCSNHVKTSLAFNTFQGSKTFIGSIHNPSRF